MYIDKTYVFRCCHIGWVIDWLVGCLFAVLACIWLCCGDDSGLLLGCVVGGAEWGCGD